MARYIDADKLIEHIKDLPTWREMLGIGWRSTKYPNGMFDCEDIINSIDNAPTADVVEVKHGHWIDTDPLEWDCSVCGYRVKRWNSTPYCPHCGTKMDGERK